MKTSNKILIGLIVIVFTVPFLLAASLKSKMEKGEYTVEKYNNNMNGGKMMKGSFTAYKVVKVIAPNAGSLTCNLHHSEIMEYQYYAVPGEDNLNISTSNDTLYIRYVAKPGRALEENGHLQINVSLPACNSLVVDGAVVIIDPLITSPGSFSVHLQNGGTIKDLNKKEDKDETADAGIKEVETPEALKVVEARSLSTEAQLEKLQNTRVETPKAETEDLLIYSLLYKI